MGVGQYQGGHEQEHLAAVVQQEGRHAESDTFRGKGRTYGMDRDHGETTQHAQRVELPYSATRLDAARRNRSWR